MKLRNKLKENKNGFTLLEVIIVIIIIGVLASLALPRMTAMTDRAKATEALNVFRTMRSAIDNCDIISNDITSCISDGDTNTDLNITLPGNSQFTYAISNVATDAYRITATFTGTAGGTLILDYDESPASGTQEVEISGTTTFAGINIDSSS